MKKMKGLSVFLLALVVLAVTALSGCSGSGNGGSAKENGNAGGTTSDEAAPKTDGKATELTYWTFNGLHVEFYQDAAKTWNEKHPDRQITLKATAYPYEEMHNKLLLSLQSGVGAPDLVDIEISKFANYVKGDSPWLVPLNDIVDPERDNFVESRLNIYSKNGQVYGLPTHVGATVMYYNKEIMDKAGVNIDDIKTWDDYVEAGKTVVAATGKPMTTVETRDMWNFWPMITQQGSDYFDKDGNVTLDNATNVKTLQFLYDMVHTSKIAQIAAGGGHHTEEYYGFMNQGGSASVLMPVWYMGRFLEYMPDLKGKIVIRPMPAWEAGGKRSAGMGGTATSITKQTKNEQLVKEFLASAKISKEGNIKIWEILGFDPPRWDVWDSPEVKADNKYTAYFGQGIFDTLLEIKDEIDSPNVVEKTPMASDLMRTQVIFKTIEEKSKTAAEALKEAADELRK
jgi:arabinosaccharide transport system substrate-binding protein